MRVVFVNRYFHPDHSATSQIASDLAFHLASQGWTVEAITSRQRYDDPRAMLPARDDVRGVRITRVNTTRFGRAWLGGRAVDYLTFHAAAFLAILRRRSSVVVAMTDPPLISVTAALAARRLVNWLQDLFPEVANALGIRAPRLLRRLRDWSLRRARFNVVLSDGMAARVPNAVVIHNWADAGLHPVERSANTLRHEWSLGEAFVVGYSGNLGRAHEFDTLLGAMRRLPDVRFLVVGSGARLDEVQRAAPPNAVFQPYQPIENLSRSLSAADVHVVSLRPELEGLIVPSKFYGALAVGRAVLFIGDADGEVARIVNEYRCGIVVASSDVEGLVQAIYRLDRDREEAAAMGRRGRELYDAQFSRRQAFDAWTRTLTEAAR